MGALSRAESEATSNSRLVDTERKMKQPGGKPESLGDAFSSGSLISMPYDLIALAEESVRSGVPWAFVGIT